MKLRHWIQIACGVLAAACFVGTIIWSIVRWYQNPDMTQMRLFLTFWKEFVTPLALAIIFYGVFMIQKKKR